MQKNIILTGGGTGGHIMPNLALVPFLKQHFTNIYYVGSNNGRDEQLVSKVSGVQFFGLDSPKLQRKLTLKNLLVPFQLHKSVYNALELLNKLKPDVVFSKGGFAALPVMLACKKYKKTKLYIHESDFTLGLANKLAVKNAECVFTAFEDTAKKIKNARFVGAPIRQEIYLGNSFAIKSNVCFNKYLPFLLILGGSSGATAINNAVTECLPQLVKLYNVIHITGSNFKASAHENMPNYMTLDFAHNIADYFATADFVISRGGANALFELVALKKPTLCIPLSRSNSRGDQILNANYFESKDCIDVLLQESLTSDALLNALSRLRNTAQKKITACTAQGGIDATRLISETLSN